MSQHYLAKRRAMLERLAPLKAAALTRWTEARAAAGRAQTWAAPHVARGAVAAKAGARRAWALAKRMFILALIGVEKALLTHKGRERTQAIAVYTLIFAFFVSSVDFLLSGGPEFGPGAQAAAYTNHVDLIAPTSGGRAEAVIEMAALGPAEAEAIEPATAVVQHTAHVEAAPEAAAEPPKVQPEIQIEHGQKDKA
jgi:hypothetical protein